MLPRLTGCKAFREFARSMYRKCKSEKRSTPAYPSVGPTRYCPSLPTAPVLRIIPLNGLPAEVRTVLAKRAGGCEFYFTANREQYMRINSSIIPMLGKISTYSFPNQLSSVSLEDPFRDPHSPLNLFYLYFYFSTVVLKLYEIVDCDFGQ